MSDTLTLESVFNIVQQTIAEVTGNDIIDVYPQAELEEELGVTPVDFKRIIMEINKSLEIELDVRELDQEEIATVKELATIVAEEALLG